ncbi:hypothetical protein [Stenotrophomonas sp. ISL-67]|uniref:hypothetical protein n=1 Tax=Stenotrophomonas sp. ISL-67 TaxID=2819171 RepID=UPI001BE7309B|nr:hypothetical protein [Stenotrophomonas sp. ISL-67]
MQFGAALSVALVGGVFFSLAPDGAGADKVKSGFAVACLMIGIAMAIAAILSRRLAVTVAVDGAKLRSQARSSTATTE